MASIFGKNFRISTFGESHGIGVGVVIDGCPSNQKIDPAKIQQFLNRRRPGQSDLTTARREEDQLEILSGLQDNITLGSPIAILVRNKEYRPSDYQRLQVASTFRASHADFTYQQKYGIRANSGGGRSSARETIGRVAAGSVAQQVLNQLAPDVQVVSFVESIRDVTCNFNTESQIQEIFECTQKSPVRCPEPLASARMETIIRDAKEKGDSVGGTIRTIVRGCPTGLGEPVFEKFEALLAHAMMSLPATKGFEIGSGFACTQMFGSQHNDEFYEETLSDGTMKTRTRSNYSGGIQGGISNGEDIYFRVAFKPPATIARNSSAIDANQARHDPCVLPRAVPIVEAMTWLVILDLWLEQMRAQALRRDQY